MTTTATSRSDRHGVSSRLSNLRRASGTWGWAFVSMGISSVTSFALSLLAGRILGANGLGVVFAGFAAYVMLLTFHRALITTPLISSSSPLGREERVLATRSALTITLSMGVACGVAVGVVGLAIGGSVGQGLLVFAPWLLPAFVQELLRSSLVRDGRARRAAVSDLSWLSTMVVCAILASKTDAVWVVVASWGLGSVVAATLGVVWMGAVPLSPSASRDWFCRIALPFGRWLALQEGSFVLGFFGLYMALTAILGVADLGGLRAAESVFAPFTLLAPALSLAGLPALSRALAVSHERAVRLAVVISGTAVLVTLAYTGLMLAGGSLILTGLFGEEFKRYDALVIPMSAGQIALATGVGFAILLHAEQRGRANLVAGLAMVLTSLSASIFLAVRAGIEGAVWGMALGAAVASVVLIPLAVRSPHAEATS
jgi:O-antigen/teichoic acid export membrane protein